MFKLPEQLVNDFVKATTDKAPKKTESFMYGTVHIDEGSIYVHLDGADEGIYTPCTTSVTVNEGDRVTIMLKNRQGVITSNLSKPTINTDYLEAGEARISGTIHAATYEDSTGNYTMDIGSIKPDENSPYSPAFSIGGYFDGDPNNGYAKLEIYFQPPDPDDEPSSYMRFPSLWIEGSVGDNPDDIYGDYVNIGVTPFGIQFNGVAQTIEGGKHVMYKASKNINWDSWHRQEES